MAGTTADIRLLVVEDEAPLRKLLVNALAEAGFRVIAAEHGEEGLHMAIQEKPDVIITDVLMPKMNGTDMLKKLREDSWGRTVPAVILTNLSADTNELVNEVIATAPDYYLVKADWSIYDVVEKVREAAGLD